MASCWSRFQLSIWAIPTAIAAFVIHGTRLWWLDRRCRGRRAMIGLNLVYAAAGIVFAVFALLSARDRRWANAAFYALITVSFLFGNRLGDVANGVLVLALVGIAASGRMRRADAVEPAEDRHGTKVFAPALVIPAVALVGTLAFKHVPTLVDPKQATLVALTLGTAIALVLCGALLRARPAEPFVAGRGLIDDVGWVAVMPQMLASLGRSSRWPG